MQSPIPTILMVLTYLYTVVILGPRLMANRKPFKLKEVLVVYNGFQVLFSLYMLYEVSYFIKILCFSFKLPQMVINPINHRSRSALTIKQGYMTV